MVICPICAEKMEIEEREISYVIGFNSLQALTKVAVCPCGVEIAMVEANFDGQTLEIGDENGTAYGWD